MDRGAKLQERFNQAWRNLVQQSGNLDIHSKNIWAKSDRRCDFFYNMLSDENAALVSVGFH